MSTRSTARRFALLALVGFLVGSPVPATAIDRTFVALVTTDAVDTMPGDGVCRSDATDIAANSCTLRAAVQEANALGGSTRITLTAGATYLLTIAGAGEGVSATGDLDVAAPLVEVLGPATGELPVVDGGQLDRVFDVAIDASLTLSRLRVSGGKVPTEVGGGIRTYFSPSTSVLTLDEVEVSGNEAQIGGGVSMLVGAVVDSRVMKNRAGIAGGGLSIGGDAVILRSTIAGNSAVSSGGGISFSSKSSDVLAVENSTVFGNLVTSGDGGAIAVGTGSVRLHNVTVDTNYGAGGNAFSGRGAIDLWNSIVARTATGAAQPGCTGSVVLHGFNLIDHPEGGACPPLVLGNDSQGEQIGVEAGLGFLGRQGGFAPSVALLAGSPAIDHGDPAGCRDGSGALFSTDQRGLPRPWPGTPSGPARCDVGALEYDVLFADGFESGDLTAWSSASP